MIVSPRLLEVAKRRYKFACYYETLAKPQFLGVRDVGK